MQKEKLSLVVCSRWTHSCGTNSKPITDGDNSSGTLRYLGNCTHLGCCRGGIGWLTHTCVHDVNVAFCACACTSVLPRLSKVASSKGKDAAKAVCLCAGNSQSYFSSEYCCTTCVMKQGEEKKNLGMKGKFNAAVLATSFSALLLLKNRPLKYKAAFLSLFFYLIFFRGVMQLVRLSLPPEKKKFLPIKKKNKTGLEQNVTDSPKNHPKKYF